MDISDRVVSLDMRCPPPVGTPYHKTTTISPASRKLSPFCVPQAATSGVTPVSSCKTTAFHDHAMVIVKRYLEQRYNSNSLPDRARDRISANEGPKKSARARRGIPSKGRPYWLVRSSLSRSRRREEHCPLGGLS